VRATANDGAHVEQKNWAVVRTVVGYHRYDTPGELLLLNKIWVLQSQMTNYFLAQQKLISKVRDGAKVTKKREGHQEVRRPDHPAPAIAAAQDGQRPRQRDHERHLRRAESGGDPTPDPSLDR
jgi:hypothetical protein